jgi:hypothetical protein
MSNHHSQSVIKRLTRSVKTLRGLSRIPNALPRPGDTAFSHGNSLTTKDLQKRQEEFVKRDQFRADKAAIRFFATAYTISSNNAGEK